MPRKTPLTPEQKQARREKRRSRRKPKAPFSFPTTPYVLQISEHDQKVKSRVEARRALAPQYTPLTKAEVIALLTKHFNEVHLNYEGCDIYIADVDLYIDFRIDSIHCNCGFFKKLYQQPTYDMYKHSEAHIKQWMEIDPAKREYMDARGKLFLELYNTLNEQYIMTQVKRITEGLNTDNTNSNKPSQIIIEHQKHFYKKERELYSSSSVIRRRLIENRKRYLYKEEYELTDIELLRGFKISGEHYGYSHFSTTLLREFCAQHNPKVIYDPFGGWGHRALTCPTHIEYIYNDLSKASYEGVNAMKLKYNLQHVSAMYNYDASEFKPQHTFDCVFTCPPYNNLEIYDGVNPFNDVKHFATVMFKALQNCTQASLIGIIIDVHHADIFKKIMKQLNYEMLYERNIKNGMHLTPKKKNGEVLLTFHK